MKKGQFPRKKELIKNKVGYLKTVGVQGLGDKTLLPVLVSIFTISRLLYRITGIQFDASPLNWFWQYIDPHLLIKDFGRSIFYLHAQPPLMNIFLGTVLNIFPHHSTIVFWSCYLILGITITISLYLLLRNTGIIAPIASGLVTIFIVSPACILYENWLFYTYPLCAALLISALMWVKFTSRPRLIYALLLFTSIGLITLLWSLFHLVWMIGCAIILLLLHPRHRKTVILGLIIPLSLVVAWYTKNLLLYRQFTASTWWGMNFSKITNGMLWPEERKALYQKGIISEISLIPQFSELKNYEPYIKTESLTGIPLLDLKKKLGGAPNFNNRAYIKIAQIYSRDALKILIHKPLAYLRGVIEAFIIFFTPADQYYFLKPNREKIQGFARIFNLIFLGQFNTHIDTKLRKTDPASYYLQSLTNTGLWLIFVYLLTLLLGYKLKSRNRTLHRALTFCWLTVLYTLIVGNFTEVGENNRFRFALDPLVIPFIAITLQNILTLYLTRNRR